MVVAGSDGIQNPPVYDVVFVVEGTAKLGGYFEAMKTSYILPALQYFNGGPPDETDYGCDYSCTLYSMVVFHAADSTPEPSCTYTGPTTSTQDFIQDMDRIKFLGGAGEACSHIGEGLATALQMFDDLAVVREPNIATQKFCILICNSPPYSVTIQDTPSYVGRSTEQLAGLMHEKGINFSVMCPRKMSVLCKLYEKANNEIVSSASMKNYTADSRHMVLLKGFHLQEYPPSPSQQEEISKELNKQPPVAANKQPSPAPGSMPSPDNMFKRPASTVQPTSQGVPLMSQPQPQQMPMNQPRPQGGMGNPGNNMVRPNQPDVQGAQANQPQVHTANNTAAQEAARKILSHVQGQVPTAQIKPMQSAAAMAVSQPLGMPPQGQISQPGPMPISQQGTMSVSQAGMITGQGMPGGPASQPMQRMPGQPFTINAPGQFQMPQRMINPGMANIPNTAMTTTVSQQQPQQQPQQQQQQQPGGFVPITQGLVNQPNPSAPNTMVTTSQVTPTTNAPVGTASNPMDVSDPNIPKATLWSGILEWQEKSKSTTGDQLKITRSLVCSVSQTSPNDAQVDTSKWPQKLMMQLIPQQLLTPLQSLFRNSRTVCFAFGNSDTETLRSLYRVMGSGFAGCVHFQATVQCDVKVLMLLYSSRKRQFMGLIPTDQARFVNGIRAVITKHKQSMAAGGATGVGVGATPQGVPQPGIGGAQPGPIGGQTQPNIGGAAQTFTTAQQGLNQQPQVGLRPGLPPNSTMNIGNNNLGMQPNTSMTLATSSVGPLLNTQVTGINTLQGGDRGTITSMGGILHNQNMQQGPTMSMASSQQVQQQLLAAQQQQQQQQQQASQQPQQPSNQLSLEEQERRANLAKIQQLTESLQMAKRQELEYQQRVATVGPTGMPIPVSQGPNPRVLLAQQQLKQVQQQQQQAQQQQQQRMQLPISQQPGQPQINPGNQQQLRHLLLNSQQHQQQQQQQQQQLRQQMLLQQQQQQQQQQRGVGAQGMPGQQQMGMMSAPGGQQGIQMMGMQQQQPPQQQNFGLEDINFDFPS